MARLDPDGLSGADSLKLIDRIAELERLTAAAKTITIARVAATRAWYGSGFRSPAEWLADRTQGSLSDAISTVQTAHHLPRAPATREAFRAGALSGAQAASISAAAVADPAAEGSLVAMASQAPLPLLKEKCREVIAAAADDVDAYERIRRARSFRLWTDTEGAVRFMGRVTPDDGARLGAVVQARAAQIAECADGAGHRERAEAYAADALIELVTGASSVTAVVHVDVDSTALGRGRTAPGERSRIRGIGHVPVAIAERLATSGIVKVIEWDGAEVIGVGHVGRTIPARVRTAVQARDPVCVVPNCAVREGLEIDHIVPLAEGGPSTVQNLARLCRWHHAQKTHHGWVLGGKPGAWTWTRPDRPPEPGGRGPPR